MGSTRSPGTDLTSTRLRGGASDAVLRRPVVVLAAATAVTLIAYGSRQSFGMFLRPLTESLGWGEDVRVMSFSTGLQALMYGLAAPVMGAAADRWGAMRVLISSGLVYALGLLGMAHSASPIALIVNIGLLTGIGSAGIALPVLLSVVGRIAPEERRSLWLGLVVSGGTAGQLLLVPLTHAVIARWGWPAAASLLAAMGLLILPLALLVAAPPPADASARPEQSLSRALREARHHRSYWLLGSGFFVCGFQVQFINNHLENYMSETALGGAMAAAAISLIGLFNMFGTQLAGWLGGRHSKKGLLSGLYLARSLVFLAFFALPLSLASVTLFACLIGLLWLATVPLTSGLVAQMFGTRYLATLYGLVFLGHQLGSFSGVWLGGVIRTLSGSYDAAWWLIIGAGLAAALLHWAIDETPVAPQT